MRKNRGYVASTTWHQAGLKPMGDSNVFIYIYIYPLLFIWIEPAIGSVAPRSTVASCLFLRREKEKIKGRTVKHFEIVSQPQGESLQTGFKRQKASLLELAGSWGTARSKVNREEV